MLILYRHIAKSILTPTLAITIVAMALFSTTRFVGILERAVSSGIGSEVFLLLFLNYPSYLLEVLPLGLYLGVILGIGKLYAENEITAILAAGTSFKTLFIGVMFPAIFVTIILWITSLWLAPLSSNKGDELWRTLTSRTSFDLIETGKFNTLSKNGMTLYVEGAPSDNNLKRIFFGEPATRHFVWSDTAVLDEGETDAARYFTFQHGVQLRGTPVNKSEITKFDMQSIKIVEPPKQTRADKAHLYSNTELLEKDTRWTRTELLYRILMPPMAIVLALVGLAYSKTKPREGRFRMVIPAIITYSIYTVMLSASVRPVYRNQAPMFTAIWWVHLVFIGFAILIMLWPQLYFKRTRKA